VLDEIIPAGEHKDPLPGKRVSVLNLEGDVHPDPSIQSVDVRLPRPAINADWPEAGGYPTHAMQHLALGDSVHELWSRSVGDGDSSDGEIVAAPVVENGRVFAMDAESKITALDAGSGKELWTFDPKPKGTKTTTFGGGLAALGDQLFVTTGYAEVLALQARTGKVIWRHAVPSPIHSPPTVADGRVYVVTVENELHVLSTSDGHLLWTHNGLPEPAGLLGGASPAVARSRWWLTARAKFSRSASRTAVRSGAIAWRARKAWTR
jgi:outer membrane protein assembly factor BamB